MSASEIIRELPKLTEADRRAIREALLELANENPDVALCNQTALEGAIMLDRMEDEMDQVRDALCRRLGSDSGHVTSYRDASTGSGTPASAVWPQRRY